MDVSLLREQRGVGGGVEGKVIALFGPLEPDTVLRDQLNLSQGGGRLQNGKIGV